MCQALLGVWWLHTQTLEFMAIEGHSSEACSQSAWGWNTSTEEAQAAAGGEGGKNCDQQCWEAWQLALGLVLEGRTGLGIRHLEGVEQHE